MRSICTATLMASLLCPPAQAGKLTPETGETCFGVGCADETIEVPKVDRPTTTPQNEAALPTDPCETVAQRIYDLCLKSPDASEAACMSEKTEALETCHNPPDHVGEGDLAEATPSSPGPTSNGIYRIPYADGTKVKIKHDYFKHRQPGKIDMVGKGSGLHSIVAAADGTIRIIEDSRSESQHPWKWLRGKDNKVCKNNFVWIEHDKGEWSKYSHMRQGSTTGKAGRSVGDRVTDGTYLGDEGEVGCAEPKHLHFEVAVPAFDPADFDPERPEKHFDMDDGGLLNNPQRQRNRNPMICGIETKTFHDGETYEAVAGPGKVGPGVDEIIRHGMPKHNYQCFIERGIAAGYQTVWVDFFELGEDIHVSVVMRPKSGNWASRSGLDGDMLKAENQSLKAQGYRLSHLESYVDKGVRYAGIWEERGDPAQKFYVGYSVEEHQAEVEALSAQGYRPRTVSVVSDGGLKYAALWEKVSGGWELHSSLTVGEYRDLARANHAKGWEVVHLNAYRHRGEPLLSAIWRPGAMENIRRRTWLGKKEFDTEWQIARKSDLLTIAVTAHEVNGSGKYTAVFGE